MTDESVSEHKSDLAPRAVTRAKRRDMCIALIARMQLQGMNAAEAWRNYHAPKVLSGTDKTYREMVSRHMKWYRENFPLNAQQQIDQAGLGLQGTIDQILVMKEATKWCPHRRQRVPDWRPRGDALRATMVLNGMFIKGGSAKGTAAEDANMKRTEQINAIVTGEQFKTTEEWSAYVDKVNKQEEERAKHAAGLLAGTEDDGEPFSDEDII